MFYRYRLLLITLFVCTVFGLAARPATAGQDGPACWERVVRVAVYNAPRGARYPSIARATDGSLLVLFTRQTAEQEKAGRGDLVLVRSADGGKTWSEAKRVYQGKDGEPRAIGTMTVLKSGRILAPFAEWINGGTQSVLRVLVSGDDGENWSAVEPKTDSPLAWLSPSGRLIETEDGRLVMSVHGCVSAADLKATIHGCGLLRSRDGGKTWGDFSVIFRHGPKPPEDPQPDPRYTEIDVLPLDDGRWLAVSRTEFGCIGPKLIGAQLSRSFSEDRGRTWSPPETRFMLVGTQE